MDASSFRDAVFQVHSHGRERGHYFLDAEDERFTDRNIHVRGQKLLSFGSCSYLGLEFDARLVEAGIESFREYGTQTPYGRRDFSSPLYRELEEDLLPKLFGAPHVLVLPSTTSAHYVMMPAVLGDGDAVVCDHQVHRSVDDAVTLHCARSNVKKVVIKHGELDRALDVVGTLSKTHEHVWFMCDGVYSMYGDILPASFLHEVLAVAPNVRMYIDDAHGMSWAGKHGRGHFLSRFPQDPRIVVMTSLNKAFAAGGGAAVLHDRKIAEAALTFDGPYAYSGQLRPGDLGVAVASAKLHLSPDIEKKQAALRARIDQANGLCRELQIPLVMENEAPIFFVALGRVEAVYLMAERLRDEGYHINVSGFPAVPASRGGLRVTINAIHTEEEVDSLFRSIARNIPSVLETVGVTRDEVAEQFHGVLPPFLRASAVALQSIENLVGKHAPRSHEFTVNTFSRIDDLDTELWDRLVGPLSYVDSRTLRAEEKVFSADNAEPEYRWSFRYVEVRDADGVAAMAPFVTSLMKHDTFMSAEVSAALEQERAHNPYFFTSRATVMGTLASEGEHMYLRPGPHRIDALVRLAEAGVAEMKAQGVSTLVLRDIRADPEIAAKLTGQAFIPVPLIESYVVDLDWKGEDEFIARLGTATRRKHVRAIREQESLFDVEVWNERTSVGDDVLLHMHHLYVDIAKKNRRINVFELPPALLRAQLASGSWEVVVLRRKEGSHAMPVAWGASRNVGTDYRWLYCGIDYEGFDLDVVSPYRQLLWQLVRRAGSLGCERLHLGMGTGREKQRFGARQVDNHAFVRADDAYSATELQEYVTKLSIRERRDA